MDNSEVLNRHIYAIHRLALATIFFHRRDNILFLTAEPERRIKAETSSERLANMEKIIAKQLKTLPKAAEAVAQ